MSVFTVASGPINFGASGGDEDFFGNDQAAASYVQPVQPAPSAEYPTASYGNVPWDVSGGYTAQEPVEYPVSSLVAATAADDFQQPPGYSNPLYDASATYQPPQATGIESWGAPGPSQAAPEYVSYEQPPPPAAALPPPPPPAENFAAGQWDNRAPPASASAYEDSIAKRELSFRENIAPPPTNYAATSTAAVFSEPPQQQQPLAAVQQSSWTMPTSTPSMTFTDNGEDDAALFDQIDASFSENLNEADSLLSSSTGAASAPSTAATTTAAVMPVTNTEMYGGQVLSPTTASQDPFTSQAPPPLSPPAAVAPPPPPMSPPPPSRVPPPSFQPAPYQPPTAPPSYQYPTSNSTAPPTYSTIAPPPPAVALGEGGSGSKPLSHGSSLDSSPRPGNISLEAGRRKLEELKRRKHAVLGARRTPGVSGSSSPLTGGGGGSGAAAAAATAAAVQERFQAELTAALSRATAAEASNADLSRDLDLVLRQLETVDLERNSLQREKAAMVGEMMSMQTSLEAAKNQPASSVNIEEYEADKKNAELKIQELETARQDLIALVEAERSEYLVQLETLQKEKDAAVAQSDKSSQRASQYNEEVQQWIEATQADSQAIREDNERLRQELETALASAAAAAAIAPGCIKQEDDQQQQYYQEQSHEAYYGAQGAEQPTSNAVEVEQVVARAVAAEAAIETLRTELENARNEASSLREDVVRLKNEAAAMDRLHLDSPSNSRRAANNDPESLRYRLAKAEAAVEKERRMIQSLERQVRDSEAAAAEGRASTAAAFELRHRCDAAEREAAAAKRAFEQLQQATAGASGASAMTDAQVQQMLSRLRLAEEKATSTDAIATDLRSQCDAAAKTIAKLVEENQNLMDRLNRQGNAMAELQESSYNQHHPRLDQSPPPPQLHQHQFTTPSPTHTAPPVWNIPGAVPIQPILQQQEGGYYNGGEEEEIQGYANGSRDGRGDGAPRYNQESSGVDGGSGGGKKKGFWSWLAGEDLTGES